jgi:hypothetical protein
MTKLVLTDAQGDIHLVESQDGLSVVEALRRLEVRVGGECKLALWEPALKEGKLFLRRKAHSDDVDICKNRLSEW